MQDDLIRDIAGMMTEQAAAYGRLESATNQLSGALTTGEPAVIESLTKAGIAELTRMRSRLLEMTSALTQFTEMRAAQAERIPLDSSSRAAFESAARTLLDNAKRFQRASMVATGLARSGSAFATACIQVCGVQPSTYQAPVLRNAEGVGR
jgi:hypothetical protein